MRVFPLCVSYAIAANSSPKDENGCVWLEHRSKVYTEYANQLGNESGFTLEEAKVSCFFLEDDCLGITCQGESCALHSGELVDAKDPPPGHKRRHGVTLADIVSYEKNCPSREQEPDNEIADDFTPQFSGTFPIVALSDEIFYEDITQEGAVMQGGYQTTTDSGDDEASLSLQILDPDGEVLFEESGATHWFRVVAKKEGTYTFKLSNAQLISSQWCTFVFGHDQGSVILKHDHVLTVSEQLTELVNLLKKIQVEAHYYASSTRSHMKTVDELKRKSLLFAFLEFVILIGVSLGQVYYIKQLVASKRVV